MKQIHQKAKDGDPIRRKKGWYILLRAASEYAETAGAVRWELENVFPHSDFQIVELKTNEVVQW